MLMTLHSGQKGGQNAKRFVVFALFVCFVMVYILSMLFIVINAGHAHDNDGAADCCKLCVDVASAASLLTSMVAAIGGAMLTSHFLLAATVALYCGLSFLWFSSPVKLKIRMNN